MSKLDELFDNINKSVKDTICYHGIHRVQKVKIPLSSIRANYMLYGGIPQGRAIQFFGEKSSGKTTTALDVVGNAQKMFAKESEETGQPERKAVYIDAENTLDVDWAETLGVNTEKMEYIEPKEQSAEQIFDIIIKLVETREVGIIVLDSVGVLLSKSAWEKDIDEQTMGGIAKPLTTFCGKVTPLLRKYNCTLLYINQIRDVIGSRFPMQSTPGGRALAHSLSLNLKFQRGAFIDEDYKELPTKAENPAGNLVMISIEKSKVCRQDRRTGFYTLNYATGIDYLNDLFDLCMKYNLIEQRGPYYSLYKVNLENGEVFPCMTEEGKELKFQGMSKMADYFRNNPDTIKYYTDTLMEMTKGDTK